MVVALKVLGFMIDTLGVVVMCGLWYTLGRLHENQGYKAIKKERVPAGNDSFERIKWMIGRIRHDVIVKQTEESIESLKKATETVKDVQQRLGGAPA